MVIPFNAVIEKNNDIKNHADYLFKEASGAVMSWIIEGAYKFIEAGYEIEAPEIVRKAIEDYRTANDWLNNYLTECCEIDKSFTQMQDNYMRIIVIIVSVMESTQENQPILSLHLKKQDLPIGEVTKLDIGQDCG